MATGRKIDMGPLAALRQLRYPREFRITADGAEVGANELEEILRRAAASLQSGAASTPPLADDNKRRRVLADLISGLWRLKKKMEGAGVSRSVTRHLDSVWDVLSADGIQVYDHENEDFDSGKSLKVAAFQPTPGLRRERVIETIKPTVYHHDQAIQMGEVIVGTPETAAEETGGTIH